MCVCMDYNDSNRLTLIDIYLLNSMSVTPKQSIFKIVSLTKHQPIFLLENAEGRNRQSEGEMMAESARQSLRKSIRSVKEEISKISTRIGLAHASSSLRPHFDQSS